MTNGVIVLGRVENLWRHLRELSKLGAGFPFIQGGVRWKWNR
jgi:hypothetical protein